MKDYEWFGLVALGAVLVLLVAAAGYSVRNEMHARDACKAKGGQFMSPRGEKPLCLKPDALLEGAK